MRFGLKEKTGLLLGLFVACLVLANVLGSKIMEFALPDWIAVPLNVVFFPLIYTLQQCLMLIGGRELPLAFFNIITVSAGTIVFPLLFLITDIIAEIHGKKKVVEFIMIGVVSMILMTIVVAIALALPAATRSVDPESFQTVFKITVRMTIASIIAFAISQAHDVWAFHWWKRKTSGRFLWLRNNASTIVSQLIDSTIFMFIAFYKTTPTWDVVFVVSLILPFWLLKVLYAFIDTPFAYLGVWWMRRKEKHGKTRLALG